MKPNKSDSKMVSKTLVKLTIIMIMYQIELIKM